MQRTEKKSVGRKTDLIRVVSWSELYSYLLGDILGRLCVTYQARFHAVCKSWRHVHPINKFPAVWNSGDLESSSVLSWFVRVDRKIRQSNSTLELSLYEPCHSIRNPISVHTISLSELGIPIPSSEMDIKIFCKYSWFFISIAERQKINFILFSPLTKTLKQLPPCLHNLPWKFEQSFSSDPESADCVFLLLDTCSLEDRFIVSTYRKDDKEWTVRLFRKVRDFQPAVCKPMYTGGIFYIVSPLGQVTSYNIITKKIIFKSLLIDNELAENNTHHRLYNLFMVNGELMYNFTHKTNTHTKRFDRSKKVWIPVSSLQDLAIIDDEKPHSVANMIEFFNSGCLICSLESFDLNQFMPNSSEFMFGPGNSFFWLKPPLIQ